MTGPAASVQAMIATTPFHNMEAEDFAAGVLEFESGAVGSIFASTSSFPGDAECIIFDCANGSASLKLGVLKVNWHDGRVEQFGEVASTGGGADPMAFPYDWHKSLISDFANSILTGRTPRVTGLQALEVHRLIAAIVDSARSGQNIKIVRK